jgi:hypothetical protein
MEPLRLAVDLNMEHGHVGIQIENACPKDAVSSKRGVSSAPKTAWRCVEENMK